tara:strand:- start:756 stop:971 length:216 start_codon:yes stop_codon:yes gene_type:complete
MKSIITVLTLALLLCGCGRVPCHSNSHNFVERYDYTFTDSGVRTSMKYVYDICTTCGKQSNDNPKEKNNDF